MVVLFTATLIGGLSAFLRLNIEAYPDPTPPMVDVITQSAGLSAEEIERYITIPIETQTAGLPNLRTIRTISLYGLSDVKLQFSFDFTYEQALQQVLNRLSQLPPLLNGAQPQISPVSPIGEIYRYRLVGPPGYSVTDLKTLQDWILQRRFRAVPGVIDVTGWGGKTRQYEVEIDRYRPAVGGGARGRPDSQRGRPQEHDVGAERRLSCSGQRYRHRESRIETAAWHRGHEW
jgi:cobalt-zinc-cadmium resistance protein CzcA